jgi:uncharacterized Ntn-hydrolase superfamily protein
MKRVLVLALVAAVLGTTADPAAGQTSTALEPGLAGTPARPVHTYSIVARDSVTGEIGVAVQSHWFSVGTVVSWAEAGVGAVATQSLAEISYGPLGLAMMRAGKTAQQTLDALLAADPNREVRQVAMVDADGNVAVHTGSRCIAEAGHRTGGQFSVQANLMELPTVPDAMARAYESAAGDLADRMLAALEAAQAKGGDIRGKQSAAVLIVKPESSGRPYLDKAMDLRVDDHAEPIRELRRLITVHRAYEYMNAGDEHLALGDDAAAQVAYARAAELMPDNPEIKFWAAITMMKAGQEREALSYFAEVFEVDEKWREVVLRLPPAGLLPDDPAMIESIVSAGR